MNKPLGFLLCLVCASANAGKMMGKVDCEGEGSVTGTYSYSGKSDAVGVSSSVIAEPHPHPHKFVISRINQVTSPAGQFVHTRKQDWMSGSEESAVDADLWEMKGYKPGEQIELTAFYSCELLSFEDGKITRKPVKWHFVVGPWPGFAK